MRQVTLRHFDAHPEEVSASAGDFEHPSLERSRMVSLTHKADEIVLLLARRSGHQRTNERVTAARCGLVGVRRFERTDWLTPGSDDRVDHSTRRRRGRAVALEETCDELDDELSSWQIARLLLAEQKFDQRPMRRRTVRGDRSATVLWAQLRFVSS